MTQPFFTIIIPAYNCADYIEDTLISLQRQDYENWECIVVNDCSTDNTDKKVKNVMHRDGRIKLITNDTNQGASGSRNRGLKVATGKYVGFLDADDYYQPGLLSKAASVLEDNIDLLKFSLIERYYTHEGDIKRDIPILLSEEYYTTPEDIMSFAIKSELLPAFGYVWNGFYSLHIINTYKITFDRNLIVNEDFKFNVDYIQHVSKVTSTNFIGYIYGRSNSNSLSSRKDIDFYGLSVIKTRHFLDLYQAYHLSSSSLLDDIYWMYSRTILASLARKSSQYSSYMAIWQEIHKDPIFMNYKNYQFNSLSAKQKIMVLLARSQNSWFVYQAIKTIQYIKDHMEDVFSLMKR